jgi:hypothetical protein
LTCVFSLPMLNDYLEMNYDDGCVICWKDGSFGECGKGGYESEIFLKGKKGKKKITGADCLPTYSSPANQNASNSYPSPGTFQSEDDSRRRLRST